MKLYGNLEPFLNYTYLNFYENFKLTNFMLPSTFFLRAVCEFSELNAKLQQWIIIGISFKIFKIKLNENNAYQIRGPPQSRGLRRNFVVRLNSGICKILNFKNSLFRSVRLGVQASSGSRRTPSKRSSVLRAQNSERVNQFRIRRLKSR